MTEYTNIDGVNEIPDQNAGDLGQNTVYTDLEKAAVSDEDKQAYEKNFESRPNFWQRIKATWQGKTDFGRITGTLLDVAEIAAPNWAVKARDIIQSKTKSNDMSLIKKALSIKGIKDFFKYKDEDGNFSWEQVGVSVLQIVIFVLLAWLDSQYGLGLVNAITGS